MAHIAPAGPQEPVRETEIPQAIRYLENCIREASDNLCSLDDQLACLVESISAICLPDNPPETDKCSPEEECPHQVPAAITIWQLAKRVDGIASRIRRAHEFVHKTHTRIEL